MADNRLALQAELEALLSSNKVYFQPPSSIKLSYPCIIYELDGFDINHANSLIYRNKTRYTVTVIDQSPESRLPLSMLDAFEYCSFDRHFISDNLNHYLFTLYY